MVDQPNSGEVKRMGTGTAACVALINKALSKEASGPSVFVAFKSPLSALIIQELERLWLNKIMFYYPRNDTEPFLIEIKLAETARLTLRPFRDQLADVDSGSSKGKVINRLV